MVRKLRHHEHRLLRKVDFISYPSASHSTSERSASIRRRYMLQNPSDYGKYNTLAGSIRQFAHRLSNLDPTDPFRISLETQLLDKLYDMGLIKRTRRTIVNTTTTGNTKGASGSEGMIGGVGLSAVEKEVTVSSFARRRLPVVMVRTGMVEHLSTAVKFVEQAHVRVGTETITDPAFLVTRNLQDFITWTDGSKIKRVVEGYRDRLDDFDLL